MVVKEATKEGDENKGLGIRAHDGVKSNEKIMTHKR